MKRKIIYFLKYLNFSLFFLKKKYLWVYHICILFYIKKSVEPTMNHTKYLWFVVKVTSTVIILFPQLDSVNNTIIILLYYY